MNTRLLLLAIATSFSFASSPASVNAADPFLEYRTSLEKIDPHVLPPESRDSQREMMRRFLRNKIAATNAESTAQWNKIRSRQDWEAFRVEKLKLLATSLSRQHFVPGTPTVTVSGTIHGEGFQIQNLVIQPAGRTIITANLYVPDPVRSSMPGIVLSHSHHNPKHEGELQDMGMTWARAGCCVLVPDHLGHGERRQHPFRTASDYAGNFAVGRQDYYFRYDMSLQLYLVGESLMGWMVHDLMSCVDVLRARPGIDSERILLLGSVAGGGDPAAVTAALDPRITCVVPFNFGGPQPESPYPLPDTAEETFNYAGSGSWESSRNLARSAVDGFLPWVIVGSIAPRHLIHAHEFAWDHDRDPAWKRYQKIWAFYGQSERLAFAHGQGTLTSKDPPGSHCNNIGAVHRRQIHDAFRTWFDIDVKPADEFSARRRPEELTCLTEPTRQQLQPKSLHGLLAARADEQLTSNRAARLKLTPPERRKAIQQSWNALLGDTGPSQKLQVRQGSPHIEQSLFVTVKREILEPEPGIIVPIMSLDTMGEIPVRKPILTAIVVSSDGIQGVLKRRRDVIAKALAFNVEMILVDFRGTGDSSAGSDRGAQGAAASLSATQLMLGESMLAARVRDLRSVLRHIRARGGRTQDVPIVFFADSNFSPLAPNTSFSFPRRIDNRPQECDPTGPLLAGLVTLLEDGSQILLCETGLVSYRSALESPFVQIPHDCIVPGVLQEADLPDLVAGLVPTAGHRSVMFNELVDARGRRVPLASAESAYEIAVKAFADANHMHPQPVGTFIFSEAGLNSHGKQ